ncbi:MAG: hypothetical protein WD355_05240 [Balneolaceae bacterium]
MKREKLSLVERVFLLKNTPPFDILEDQELLNIAEVLTNRAIPEGEPVQNAGNPVNELIILAEGHVADNNGGTSLKILGVSALLRGTPAVQTLSAGPGGALILKLEKGHFFTTVYECSGLLVAFMKLLNEQEPYFS